MNDEINTQSDDDGGMCAEIDTLADVPYAVAPSVEKRYNTIRLAFLPTACWRMDDDRFDFDSSFILPTSTREFAMLADKRPPGPPSEPGTGPYIHVVQSGEWLDGIAKSYGFESWRDLYYADDNAGYRANHPDPDVLYPGDEIVIPGRTGGDTTEPQEDPEGLRLTVFGHADPTGRDEYNHVLAGRRAKAVFGLLVRDVEMWDELYRVSHGGDQWKLRHMQLMLVKCGYAAGEPDGVLGTNTMDATRAFQRDQGIAPSGYVDVATRKKLFRAYMDAICVNGSGKPFRYNRKDFLSRGETKDGKADYQSCSEFNPMVVFSQEEESDYAKPENKGQRDEDNAVNRRVTIYMFPTNPRFPPEKWPCPTIKEGCGRCKGQFWIDGEKRRSPQGERRDSRKRGKTMACKWYDRMTWRGSCEGQAPGDKLLKLATPVPPSVNVPVELVVQDDKENTIRVLPSKQGFKVGNLLAFRVRASQLPIPCKVAFRCDGRILASQQIASARELQLDLKNNHLESALCNLEGEGQTDYDACEGAGGGTPPAERSGAKTSRLFLEIKYRDKNAHHLLKAVRISATHTDARPSGQGHGGSKRTVLEVRVANHPSEIEIVITVPDPRPQIGNRPYTPLVEIRQRVRLKALDGGYVIDPVGCSHSGMSLHPRLTLTQVWSGTPPGVVLVCNVDLTFLPVGNYLYGHPQNDEWYRFLTLRWQESAECKWSMYEYTQGHPATWVVARPSSIANGSAKGRLQVDAFLYFQHEFTGSTAPGATHYQGCDDIRCWRRLDKYFGPWGRDGAYVQGKGRNIHWMDYPSFGWDHQLNASSKPVLLVLPFPHNTDFGDVHVPTNASEILGSLLLALFCDGLVAANRAELPWLGRLAVGGWSSGTETALAWCTSSKGGDLVDELYMFDGCDRLHAGWPGGLSKEWLRAKSERRVRLIGTGYSQAVYTQYAKLLNHPTVTAMPEQMDYWYTDEAYKRALSLVGEPTTMFSELQDTALTLATARSNIFQDSFILPKRELRLTSPGCTSVVLMNVAPWEAAAEVAFNRYTGEFTDDLFPVTNDPQLARVAGRIAVVSDSRTEKSRIPRLRHPWSVMGGQWRNGQFVGYLQWCLENSDF